MQKSDLKKMIREIISEVVLQEGPRDPGIFKAIYLAGGPGSGKSFVVKKLGLTALGLKVADPDKVYEYLIRREHGDISTFDISTKAAQDLRTVASRISDRRDDIFVDNRLGVVFDGTGKNFDKVMRNKLEIEKLGYETAMIFVNSDIETSLDRNRNRARKVPDEMVKKFWQDVQRNIGKFQSAFGEQFFIIDNSSTDTQSRKNANISQEVNVVYSKIRNWVKQSPRSPIAKKWIENQK